MTVTREVALQTPVRTAIGTFKGSLKDIDARELAVQVVKEATPHIGDVGEDRYRTFYHDVATRIFSSHDERATGATATIRGVISEKTIFRPARLLALLISGLSVALAPVSAQSAEQLQEKPMITRQSIVVEHIRIESAKSFADVRSALERSVPHRDPSLGKALADGDVERVQHERREGPELSIFLIRDHGALLKITGRARNALQYDIGNPVTATLMTRYRLSAALYAPIRVVLYENDAGHGVFEYDQPSTTFGQFGDDRVTDVARGLDAALSRALLGAAE